MNSELAKLKATIDAIQEEIDNTLVFVGSELLEQVTKNPASFECGYSAGMKRVSLDIDRILNDE